MENIPTIEVFTVYNLLGMVIVFFFFFLLRFNNTNIFSAFNKLFTAEIAKSATVTANMKGKPLVNLEQETSV